MKPGVTGRPKCRPSKVEEVVEQEVSESTAEEVAPVETIETQEVSEVDVPTQEEPVGDAHGSRGPRPRNFG